MKKITFITEAQWFGKVLPDNSNMRTEISWMYALNAEHVPLQHCLKVKDQDHVFLILPKGELSLNMVGVRINDQINPWTKILGSNFIDILKSNNGKVHYIQEGPTWLFNDYEIVDQFNFYNNLAKCDSIFAHNDFDTKFYKGLFPNKEINVIPSLLIEDQLKDIVPSPEEKVIIGGNFARWYGGFQSYLVADELGVEKWTQESHAKRENEDQIPDLNHLPRLEWLDWMKGLSHFKYAVHLMPTIAAGTFSLNCAYFGIPCIGNAKVDTQRLCHPLLSVDVEDVESARKLAIALKDPSFYKECSEMAKRNYRKFYDIEQWNTKINSKL